MTVFLDMDGVLCDFLGGFHRKFGLPFKDVPEMEAWKLVKQQPNLWAELDPFPGAIDFYYSLMKFVHGECNLFILTAVPKSSFIDSANNKRAWVHKHLGRFGPIMIPCQGGYNKAGYVQERGDILIDDNWEKNLLPWINNGGVAVHHPEGSDFKPTFETFRKVFYG